MVLPIVSEVLSLRPVVPLNCEKSFITLATRVRSLLISQHPYWLGTSMTSTSITPAIRSSKVALAASLSRKILKVDLG